MHGSMLSKGFLAATVSCVAFAGVQYAQGYKVNLPLPSDAGFGGGDVVRFRISPDETLVAYQADQDTVDVLELFVAPTDGSRVSRKLNPPLGERSLIVFFTFSPDSTRVLFIADTQVDEQFELYSAPVDGSGPAVRLHGPVAEGGDVGDDYFTQPVVFSETTQRVVFGGDLEQNDQFQLYSSPIDGSAPPVVLNGTLGPDRDANHEFFHLTPDGSRVLYFSDEANDNLFDLWSVPVDGAASPTLVLAATSSSQGIGGEANPVLLLTPDGSEIVFTSDVRLDGVFELYRMPSDGSAPPVPLLDPLPGFADVLEFGLTPDGNRVIYRADAQTDHVFHLWSAPIHGGAPAVRLSGPMPGNGDVDGAGSWDGPFQISPDGARVVYRADQIVNDRSELFSAPVDGSAPTVRLTRIGPGGNTWGYRITPDGKRVVYVAKRGSFFQDELFVVFIGGGGSQRLSGELVELGHVQRDFRVGDEHVVFRADARVDEQFELFSAPLRGFPPPVGGANGVARTTGPRRLTSPLAPQSDVDTGFVLSADGEQVFLITDHATAHVQEVFVAPVDGSDAPLVVSGELTAGPPVGDVHRFGFTGTRMMYSANQDLPQIGELFSVSVDEPPQRLKLHDHALSGGTVLFPRATPDGARVVYLCDAHVLQQYELFSVPADGLAPPVELSGTVAPIGGDVFEDFHFTPDGSRVVFRGNLDSVNVNELYSAPLDGSAPQVKLNPALSGERDVESDLYVSPDSAWIVYRADQDTDDVIELYSVPVDGSVPAVKLNGPMVSGGDVFGHVSTTQVDVLITPGSDLVVYAADQEIDDVFEVFVAPIDGASAALRLNVPLSGARDASLAAVTPDGVHVLFRSDELVDERNDLYRVPIDGSQPPVRISQDSLGDAGVGHCAVTPDGSRAVYIARKIPNGFYGVFSVPVDGSEAPIEIGEPTDAQSESIHEFLTSPDGERVVYTINGNPSALVSAWVDGSLPHVRLADFESVAEAAFAANDELVFRGRALEYSQQEVFRVGLSGEEPPQRLHDLLPLGREATEFALDSSGERVLYRADQEADERYELYLVFLTP